MEGRRLRPLKGMNVTGHNKIKQGADIDKYEGEDRTISLSFLLHTTNLKLEGCLLELASTSL